MSTGVSKRKLNEIIYQPVSVRRHYALCFIKSLKIHEVSFKQAQAVITSRYDIRSIWVAGLKLSFKLELMIIVSRSIMRAVSVLYSFLVDI